MISGMMLKSKEVEDFRDFCLLYSMLKIRSLPRALRSSSRRKKSERQKLRPLKVLFILMLTKFRR
jgi:hypothetical protein